MSQKHQENKADKGFENIEEALTSSERFIEKNQKTILIVLAAIVVIVGGIIAYNYLYKNPRNEKAQAALYKGERYFQNQQDSIALFGNGNDYIGFENIIREFSGTKTADLARAYAGISHSRLGNNEQALDYLNKFNGGDFLITPAVMGAVGDVYMNMGNTEKAISQFNSAARKANDEMLSPIYYNKVGLAYLSAKNFDKAIETFQMIKDRYINSPQGQEADKYIKAAQLQQSGN
ncbi:MAG: tetratricopeptide repeat protein [Bacteroidia bacterium]|nr:tetratricopeptide repeat protein [Bacteroidia bacterium]